MKVSLASSEITTITDASLLFYLFCVIRNPASYKIVVGDHNRNTNEGTEEEVEAQRIISHPSYNRPSPINNDIALIKLSRPVKLSQRVNPICLPSYDSDVPTGSKCYITGQSNFPRDIQI